MKNETTHEGIKRREFLKNVGMGAVAIGVGDNLPLQTQAQPETRNVFVMSDIHIGNTEDGKDGAEYLEAALDDVRKNLPPISYGLMLGDITQNGDRPSMMKYLALRNKSCIRDWHEIAGNHEYYHKGIANFKELIRDTKPHHFIDGNIAWFFISDEVDSRPGNMLDDSHQWLRRNMAKHQDKTIIVCSHQLPANTVRKSNEDVFCLHPKEHVEDLLKSFRIDLWMFGHEHHAPYSKESFTRKGNTTFINVASMNHAYGTGASESFVLELKTGAKEIVARRRHHDKQEFRPEFEIRIPLRHEIQTS